MAIQTILRDMKYIFENSIIQGGSKGQLSLIRSQRLINFLHEYVKDQLIAKGVDPNKIYPPQGHTKPELKMSGLLKTKAQDICVLPNHPTRERISEGPLWGTIDNVGYTNTNTSIVVNARSQLSSIAKNFDTLYERTFAEPLNLHLRAPLLVMGELYLIPTIGYDAEAMKSYRVQYTEQVNLSKYIRAFQAVNGRNTITGDEYKYERVCLLIVEFRSDPPEIINSINQLTDMKLVKDNEAEKLSLSELTVDGFIEALLGEYKTRHGNLDAILQS